MSSYFNLRVCVLVFGSIAANSSLKTRHVEFLSPPCGPNSNYTVCLGEGAFIEQLLGETEALQDFYTPGFAAPPEAL